jgi:hypothetical protein
MSNFFSHFLGEFNLKETETGIQIQICQPHLISLSQKKADQELRSMSSISAKKTSIKIFPLKFGRTTIGSSPTNDIVLNSFGIRPEHCFIEKKSINPNNKQKDEFNIKSSDSSFAPKSNLENNINEPSRTSGKTKKTSISISSLFKENTKCNRDCQSENLVTLYPIDKLCAIDGVLIENPYNLNSGLFLFIFSYFSFSK